MPIDMPFVILFRIRFGTSIGNPIRDSYKKKHTPMNAGFDAGASAFDSIFTGGGANENAGFDSTGCSAFFKSSSRAF